MEVDYDQWFEQLLTESLENAIVAMSPEQQARLAREDKDHLDERLEKALSDTADGAADLFAGELKARGPEMLEHRQRERERFEAKLREYWGRAFDLADVVLNTAHEIGTFFYNKHVPPDGVHDFTFEALGRLVARACRVAEEVLVLLKTGYGQAALARARTLHEIKVVAAFVFEYGDAVAERFFEHEAVENWKAMQEFQEHAITLGETPYSDAEMNAGRARYDALIAKYPSRFGRPYGWAQEALAATKPELARRAVTFRDLEESVDAAHFRPHYRMASQGVHANPKGVIWTPDLLPSEVALVLLTGPSPIGLADPGHQSLIDLTSVVTTALASKAGAATVLLSKTLQRLTDEAGEAYLEAHNLIEADLGLETDIRETSVTG